MAILVYNSTKEEATSLRLDSNESFIFVTEEDLNETIDALFKQKIYHYQKGKRVMIFKDMSNQMMKEMMLNVNKMQLECIYAVYNENNQYWKLKDLIIELLQEDKWFQLKKQLEDLLKKCNLKTNFKDEEKKKIMKAYLRYQEDHVRQGELEESIHDLKKIIT